MKHAALSRMKRVLRHAEEEDGLPLFIDTAWMSRDDSVLALPYDGRHLPVLTDVVFEAVRAEPEFPTVLSPSKEALSDLHARLDRLSANGEEGRP